MESNHGKSTTEIKQQIQFVHGEKRRVINQKDSVLQKIMAPVVDDERSAWKLAREGVGFAEIDTKASLVEELEALEAQERFYDEAIKGGQAELNRARGQESLAACAAARPAVIAAAKIVLMGLREIERGNREFQRIIDDLHERDHQTGSLPVVTYNAGGRWEDPFRRVRGGLLQIH
jgi:hypothetical protein